jgi:DNA-directed RNA polymerase subunit RPC12/RpoP
VRKIVSVEIATTCATCGTVMAINAVVTSASCPKCGRVEHVAPDFWRDTFAAASTQVAPQVSGFETTLSLESAGTRYRVVMRRADAPHTELRPLQRPDLQTSTVVGTIAEDVEGMRVGDDLRTRMLHCPACGAPLEVHGEPRDVVCTYCRKQSQLEGLTRIVKRWYLVCEVAENAGGSTWGEVWHVAVDVDSNVYVLGMLSGAREAAIIALDTTLKTRWVKGGLPLLDCKTTACIGFAANRIVVTAPARRALMIDASTGATLGEMPAASVDVPRSIVPCDDGTWLLSRWADVKFGETPHSLLSRLDATGETMNEVWPGVFRQRSAIEVDIPALETATQPSAFFQGNIDLIAARDGDVLLTNGSCLAYVDRFGTPKPLRPVSRDPWDARTLSGRNGYVHTLTANSLLTVDMTGRVVRKIARGHEKTLAVGRRGDVVLVGHDGRLRVLAPDGTVTFVNDVLHG